MRRHLLQIFTVCAFSIFACANTYAQTAPDFTETDIYGVEQNLYSYLDDGKAAILDFSATWCGPCWSLHQSHLLEELYEAYGPEGADILTVMYIESDPSTTLDDLYGTGSNTAGNWVEGTSYPIIDLATNEVVTAYGVTKYPTVFTVNPAGDIVEDLWSTAAGPTDFENWSGKIFEMVSPIEGKDVVGYGLKVDDVVCQETTATLNLFNKGDVLAENMTVEIYANGTLLSTESVDVSLGAFESAEVELPISGFPTDSDVDIMVNVILADDSNVANNTSHATIVNALETEYYIDIVIVGDPSAGSDNTNWVVVDAAGNEYADGTVGNSQEIDVRVHVPNIDCYSFIIKDPGFGDGMIGGAIEVTTSNGEVLFDDPKFGITGSADFYASITSNVEDENLVESAVFPNPSDGNITLEVGADLALPATISVENMLGQTVYKKVIYNTVENLNLGLDAGLYNTTLRGANDKVSLNKIIIH